jgi:hypothetical protein
MSMPTRQDGVEAQARSFPALQVDDEAFGPQATIEKFRCGTVRIRLDRRGIQQQRQCLVNEASSSTMATRATWLDMRDHFAGDRPCRVGLRINTAGYTHRLCVSQGEFPPVRQPEQALQPSSRPFFHDFDCDGP